jgi:hypothetical protein
MDDTKPDIADLRLAVRAAIVHAESLIARKPEASRAPLRALALLWAADDELEPMGQFESPHPNERSGVHVDGR